MGAKDMTEKYLESYNDVFADIVNVLLFRGEQIMQPNQLANSSQRAVYKAGGNLHEEERDISKYWKKRRVCIAVCGIENQTGIDTKMPLRVIGYDGAAYKEQTLKGAQKEKYPVISLVLYFGIERSWERPLRLSDCFSVPDMLRPFFSDYQIHVFSIAFLSKETIRLFKSDFGIVADYFYHKRTQKNYIPSKQKIKHVDAVLKLMAAMTGDSRFEEVQKGGEVHNMCEILDQVEQRGIKKGVKKGVKKGIKKGKRMGQLDELVSLVSDGLLSQAVAAQRAKMNESEFAKLLRMETGI